MKQTYVKPHMIVERFSLTQSIASGCGTSLSGSSAHADKYTCGWSFGGKVYFIDKTICKDFQLKPDEEIEGFCYNNPDGGIVFNS